MKKLNALPALIVMGTMLASIGEAVVCARAGCAGPRGGVVAHRPVAPRRAVVVAPRRAVIVR